MDFRLEIPAHWPLAMQASLDLRRIIHGRDNEEAQQRHRIVKRCSTATMMMTMLTVMDRIHISCELDFYFFRIHKIIQTYTHITHAWHHHHHYI